MRLLGYAAVVAVVCAALAAGWELIGAAGGTAAVDEPVERVEVVAPPAPDPAPPPVAKAETKAPAATFAERVQVFDAFMLSPQATQVPATLALPVMAFSAPEPIRAPTRQALAPARQALAPVRQAPGLDPRKVSDELRLDKTGGVLTPSQIAMVKSYLNLTPEQEQHWPAVEVALNDVARKLAGDHKTIDAVTAQRLYWTAGPLILSLRDDQKRALRTLARMVGLGPVAALI